LTLNVGVIGVGMIDQDHLRRLTRVLSGARVSAVTDVNLDRAKSVAAGLPAAKALQSGQELIDDPEVDAVVVTSWGPTHEEYVLGGIAAGKQVFCEKPLASGREACQRIVDAEVAAGKRLVMVGFMRRCDDGYRAMKQVIDAGEIGAPLMFHSVHRNASVPPHYVRDMIMSDTCVHDVDVARFLLGTEIVAAAVHTPRKNSLAAEHLTDPVLFLFEMADGALVDVEASINIQYGYDIRGEVVGERGTVALPETGPAVVKSAGRVGRRVPEDWRERFLRAYDVELQEWIDAASAGRSTGPSAWDGYAATVVCDAGLAATQSGERVEVSLREQPDMYRVAVGAGRTGTDATVRRTW
jgi:myo-inositol 2-dehydrogenase/D-chiro-inositol 1-dehydrogenase